MTVDQTSRARRVLLIIGGGIAAYKCLELIRDLAQRGIGCRCILTKAAQQFVTPLSVAALSGEKVYEDLFSLTDETQMGHIELSRSADLVVVAPATADLMAKAAHGLAGDLASTVLLATDKPVMMVPAMNVRMWEHKATQRNLATLRGDGVMVVGPDVGAMACGEFGPGRMAEPSVVADAVEAWFVDRPVEADLSGALVDAPRGPSDGLSGQVLAGKRVVLTAGPTREPLDPVRHLTNHSSGTQGYALAAALAGLGADVVLVSGPTQLADPAGVEMHRIETAREMLAACEAALPADVFVGVAAVADWRPKARAGKKLKLKKGGKSGPNSGPNSGASTGGAPELVLELVENPDILKTIAHKRKNRPALVVGFAAETHDVIAHARAKRERKGADWIVANDVSGDVMGGQDNAVTIITPNGEVHLSRASKGDIALALAQRIGEALADHGAGDVSGDDARGRASDLGSETASAPAVE